VLSLIKIEIFERKKVKKKEKLKKPPRKNPESSKNACTWTLGTGKTQALVLVQLDL